MARLALRRLLGLYLRPCVYEKQSSSVVSVTKLRFEIQVSFAGNGCKRLACGDTICDLWLETLDGTGHLPRSPLQLAVTRDETVCRSSKVISPRERDGFWQPRTAKQSVTSSDSPSANPRRDKRTQFLKFSRYETLVRHPGIFCDQYLSEFSRRKDRL